jgi:hypothetical protein
MFVYVLRVVSYVKCRSSTLDVDILVVISGAPPDPSEVTPVYIKPLPYSLVVNNSGATPDSSEVAPASCIL